jgi:hypothetical protein
MAEAGRIVDPEGRFQAAAPAGWSAEADPDEGGIELWREEGSGALHLISFDSPEDAFPDPGEELYAFLEERGVELEEDEVEDVDLAGDAELSLCEYLAEDEDDPEGGSTFCLVGVATMPGVLVFATYLCPAGEEEAERDAVRGILASLHLTPRA